MTVRNWTLLLVMVGSCSEYDLFTLVRDQNKEGKTNYEAELMAPGQFTHRIEG